MCRGRRDRQGGQPGEQNRSALGKKMRDLEENLKKWGRVWKSRTRGKKAKKLS